MTSATSSPRRPRSTSWRFTLARLKILTAHDHPLAQCREVTAAQLSGSPFVFVSREKCPEAGYDFLMGRFRSLGISLDLVQEVDNVSALISLVAAGVGISLGAENMRDDLAQRVALLTLRGLELEFKLVLIWNKRNTNAALASFIDTMRPGKPRLVRAARAPGWPSLAHSRPGRAVMRARHSSTKPALRRARTPPAPFRTAWVGARSPVCC